MIIQKFILPFFLVLIVDSSALFYFLKDHKHQHSHEEVDHQNYHHYHHQHDDHNKHTEPKHQNHKYQGYKHQEEHNHHQQKHQEEHNHHQHKPQHMHKHQEDHNHRQHKPQQMHKHQEEHTHHEYKPQMHKHHEYDHNYHQHHHQHHGYEHKQQEEHMHHGHHDHDHKHHQHYQQHKHEGQPHYEFKYGVRDPNTGDIKNQWEMRKGDEVKGEYSLLEADGTIRTVQYTAGKHTGFNAVVKKEGKAKHPIESPVKSSTFQNPKTSFHSVKPVHQEQERADSKGKRVYTDVDTSRLQYYNPSDLPTNHKPVFSGIDEESNLLALYKHYPVHNFYRNEKGGFDYGINDYLTKRSYDLSKITQVLNASPTVDPIRAARGSFVMGR